MSADYLCKLTDKLNQLSSTVMSMQGNAGLYNDSSEELTLTGRIKALEETTIASDPTETNIARMRVEHSLVVVDGKITTEYWPNGGCVNREVMLQNPDDLDIWEPVGGVVFTEDVGDLGTDQYEGWLATVSYMYAIKITLEEFDYIDVTEELVKNLQDYDGSVYKVIITVTPVDGGDADTDADECTLKWENADDATEYVEEVIQTEHIRSVAEEEFNHKLYITGSAHVEIVVRNRLS